jgi:acyl-CoA hydrolase
MTTKSKSMTESKSIKATQVFPEHTNHLNTMFGGHIMANTDEVAAITAMKHSESLVVTASTDSVDFLKPIRSGDLVTYEALVSYVGASSMEICVQIKVENPFDGTADLAVLSFLTFVAIDQDGNKTDVPKVYPTNEEEEWLYNTAESRVNQRRLRRRESKDTVSFLSQIKKKK